MACSQTYRLEFFHKCPHPNSQPPFSETLLIVEIVIFSALITVLSGRKSKEMQLAAIFHDYSSIKGATVSIWVVRTF